MDIKKELARTARRNEDLNIKCSPEEFRKVEDPIERSYSYSSKYRLLEIQMPSFLHPTPLTWFSDWIAALPFPKDCVRSIPGQTVYRFDGPHTQSSKSPDGTLCPVGRSDPTIVMEVGYTQTYASLLRNVKLLLEGTSGRIPIMIIMKLQPINKDDREIRSGFLEVYEYNRVSQKAEILVPRMAIYLVPGNNNEDQTITFTSEQILQDYHDQWISNLSSPIPPLSLNELRHRFSQEIPKQHEYLNYQLR